MNLDNKKQLIVTIDGDVISEYKKLCKSKGYNMSQRIRNFIKTELINEKEIN